MVIIVTGVSGVGKTTVGLRLAGELGWAFEDADAYHAPTHVEQMREGVPLTDAQRAAWLATLSRLIARHVRDRQPLVLACSALGRAHREALLADVPDPDAVGLVYLRAERPVLTERLERRREHFFPPSLLESQLAAHEPPMPSDAVRVLELDASRPVDALVAEIRGAFDV
jgi:gluconokinase